MVHRPPDSRLLTNLIGNEKEYSKQLASLFPISHAALASLSAYAASSPSTPARTLAAVVDVLASADDALQRYTHAIDVWRDQLQALKDLEDDLQAVLRDRDILVTRLIKVSKSTPSRLPAVGIGSASLSSLPSSSSTTVTAGSGPATTNAKLAQAQAELQACEAHLAAKERQLDARRISVARDGLGARCRALIDCGWVWGEMGKQGLRALQALAANGHPNGGPPTAANVSDNSSLTPSQSASQTRSHAHHPSDATITLPPAHAAPDVTFPAQPPSQPQQQPRINGDTGPKRRRTKRRRPPSHHIVEVSEVSDDARAPFPQTASSDDERPVRIIDNDPLVVMSKTIQAGSMPHLPAVPVAPPTTLEMSPEKRQRRTSTVFGSLRGLFRKPKPREDVWEERGYMSASPAPNARPSGARWVTRTDARVQVLDSDDDGDLGGNKPLENGKAQATRLRKERPAADGVQRVRSQRKIKEDGGTKQRQQQQQQQQTQLGRAATAGGRVRQASETRHRRSASMDGYGTFLSMTGSPSNSGSWRTAPMTTTTTTMTPTTPVSRARPTSIEVGHASASLMRLVVDGEDRSRSLDVPRAPGSVLSAGGSAMVGGSAVGAGTNGIGGSAVGAGANGVGGSAVSANGVVTRRASATAKMPLRSALRNTSRTPSPGPAPVPVLVVEAPVERRVPVQPKAPVESKAPVQLKLAGTEAPADKPDETQDAASVSSYETGRESLSFLSLGGDEEGPMWTIPPPPVVPPPGAKVGVGTRRKSVRVSLQPTFSPPPPVEDEVVRKKERERVPSISRGKGKGKGKAVDDMWADSTSEEEVYRRAKGMLSRR